MLLLATLRQMMFLFSLIACGFFVVRLKLLPENCETTLSRLENYLFIPALVLDTFLDNFTIEKLSGVTSLLAQSFFLAVIFIAISIAVVQFCTKDNYIRKIYLYGLSFSNFGFMGNAVVMSLFPDVFLEYLLFTLVLWILIYLWGVPSLLMENNSDGLKARMKRLCNPMLICMMIGMGAGLTGFPIPGFVDQFVASLAGCMSPLAMLLTGMTIAKMNLGKVLKIKSIYFVSILRLVVYPFVFLLFIQAFSVSRTFMICATASLSMPLGLNTIVIPSAYGKDTSVASGMAMVSSLLACLTIPMVFFFMERLL